MLILTKSFIRLSGFSSKWFFLLYSVLTFFISFFLLLVHINGVCVCDSNTRFCFYLMFRTPRFRKHIVTTEALAKLTHARNECREKREKIPRFHSSHPARFSFRIILKTHCETYHKCHTNTHTKTHKLTTVPLIYET